MLKSKDLNLIHKSQSFLEKSIKNSKDKENKLKSSIHLKLNNFSSDFSFFNENTHSTTNFEKNIKKKNFFNSGPRTPNISNSSNSEILKTSLLKLKQQSNINQPKVFNFNQEKNQQEKRVESPQNIIQNNEKSKIPNQEPTRCSIKNNGIVKAYAANTNQGLVRKYNEDRVSIILNIMKPSMRKSEFWPKCSFFSIFDGHGGVNCADFLRDNLHHFVIIYFYYN